MMCVLCKNSIFCLCVDADSWLQQGSDQLYVEFCVVKERGNQSLYLLSDAGNILYLITLNASYQNRAAL